MTIDEIVEYLKYEKETLKYRMKTISNQNSPGFNQDLGAYDLAERLLEEIKGPSDE
jgi:hypothetical protein